LRGGGAVKLTVSPKSSGSIASRFTCSTTARRPGSGSPHGTPTALPRSSRAFLAPETTIWQYTNGVSDPSVVSPDGYSLDNFYMARPGADEVQLDLFGDYKSNVALYPAFQAYFHTHKPHFLAAWGKNDPFFLPAGAAAFRRDMPDAVVRFFDTGHFALETHACEIAAAICEFLTS
jgi:pimeloyl-ACP methyl ester carboxylesterase